MRSPKADFDLSAALVREVQAAVAALRETPPSPESIHRCRVSLKRARALARIGRIGAPALAAVFNETARTIMHALNDARDLAALAHTARAYAATGEKKEAAALILVAQHLEAAGAKLAPPRCEQLRASLRDLIALAQVWPEPSQRQVRKGVLRIVKRARDAYVRGRGARSAAPRHAWRKREKDRFYAADLMGATWPETPPRRRKRSEALGHALGQERDVLLLIERVKDNPEIAGDSKAAVHARDLLKARRKKLRDRADSMGAKLHRHGA